MQKRYIFIISALILSILAGCSIDNDEDVEKQVLITQVDYKNKDINDFVNKANKCIKGDMSVFEDLTKTFRSSLNPKYKQPYLYQRQEINSYFEKCMQKASANGMQGALKNIISSAYLSARISAYFYAHNDTQNGAFWLRRTTNISGLADGYQIAGEIFTQNIKTLQTGVDMLVYSADLGNKDAKAILFSLSHPNNYTIEQYNKQGMEHDK